MSTINSWSGRFCIGSFVVLLNIFLLDLKTSVLPLHGIWLLLYCLFVIILTVWLSCFLIQKLLQQNQVFEYNIKTNPFLRYVILCANCLKLKVPKVLNENKKLREIIHAGSTTPLDRKEFPGIIEAQTQTLSEHKLKSIDERIQIFASDIEERFIAKWYKHISSDPCFPSETKLLLEGVIRRVLQVSVQLDSDKLACEALVILLKHLKEYRKAVKRAGKNDTSVEATYRYAHVATKSESALEHYTHRLTGNVLREFISWELWNSLPSRLLVSILSKRLTTYIIRHVSQPGWINYRLVSQFASEKQQNDLRISDYCYISLSDVSLVNHRLSFGKIELKTPKIVEKESSTPKISPKKEIGEELSEAEKNIKIDSVIQAGSESMIEKALTQMITHQTATILQRAEKHPDGNISDGQTPPVTQKPTPEHKKLDFKPKRSEPVKIHSAQSTKVWDDNDVGNVSIGQDLLALENMDSSDLQGFSGRRLWGPSVGKQDEKHPLWELNEIFNKDSVDSDSEKMSPKLNKKGKEGKSSPPIVHSIKTSTTNAASIITNTIKPIGNVTASTLHNMRELQQSTVNNVVKPVSNVTEKAIHKIGDLQDEAVGVVEGIFDFGMAGIRKGLRLTGLQDNTEIPKIKPAQSTATTQQEVKHQLHHQDAKQSPKNVPKLVKVGHITSEDLKKTQDSVENVWINPLAKESPNGFENQMLFEKSPNAVETPKPTAPPEPQVSIPDISTDTNLYLNESPEYEEAADLASTISKLRSLLQQKSSESSLNTPAASPMPVDEKSCVTPTEPVLNDPLKNDTGGMQRFARTVTGMFNTFKGALPGNIGEQVPQKNEQWIFIENDTSDTDLPSLLNSLLIERRDYCTVDTAYEAMDSLDLLTESVTSPVKKIKWENQTFEDELDDFDASIPITKALMDVICECLLDTNCALKQEPVMKAFLVLTGRKLENILSFYAEKMMRYLNKSIGPLAKNDNDCPIAMDLEKMVTALEEVFPGSMKRIFGQEDLKIALRFLISSFQSMKINHDIVLQLSELFCSQLIYTSSQMSPTPSA